MSMIAPFILFLLARTHMPGFRISTIALGVRSRPFVESAMLGFWVGALAVVAGCGRR